LLQFDVNYFDSGHQRSLSSTLLGPSFDDLVSNGWKCDEEVFLSYCMFVHQKRNRKAWRTYADLKNKLPDFRGSMLNYFSLDDGTLTARFSGVDESRTDQTESMGVGCALGCISHAAQLTEADWERIDVSKEKDLDFQIASTGSQLLVAEARGRIRDDSDTQRLDTTAREIAQKKTTQRQRSLDKCEGAYPSNATFIGVIAAIPHLAPARTRILLLDPPPIGIWEDPFKYRIVARLNFYLRQLSMICGRANVVLALANHIRAIELAANFRALDREPLLTGTRSRIQFPQAIVETRTVTSDERVVGEIIPLKDRSAFFFGLDVRCLRMLLAPSFSEIASFRCDLGWTKTAVKLAARVRESDANGLPTFPPERKKVKSVERVEFAAQGELSATPAGVILGPVEW